MTPDTANPIRIFPYALAFVLVALLFLAVVIGIRYHDQAKVNALAAENHAVLCAFKHDRQESAERTRQFISELRSGIRPAIPGITVADLERTLANVESTLNALRQLDCS